MKNIKVNLFYKGKNLDEINDFFSKDNDYSFAFNICTYDTLQFSKQFKGLILLDLEGYNAYTLSLLKEIRVSKSKKNYPLILILNKEKHNPSIARELWQNGANDVFFMDYDPDALVKKLMLQSQILFGDEVSLRGRKKKTS